MGTETILGIAAALLLVAFIVFALRKGRSVKPSGKDISQTNDYT